MKSSGKKSVKLNRMLGELKCFLNFEFMHESFFVVIYGSYADGVYTEKSDLDLMIICKTVDKKRNQRAIQFVVDLHNKFCLKLDYEVKYEKKLILSYDFLIKCCLGEGFKKENKRFFVPPIIKTRKFLNSEELLLRLILSNIAHKHIFVAGDKKLYLKFRDLSIKCLTSIVLSNKNMLSITKNKLVDAFIWNGGLTGDYYLGYLDRLVDREYLAELSTQIVEALIKEKLIKKRSNEYILYENFLEPAFIESLVKVFVSENNLAC